MTQTIHANRRRVLRDAAVAAAVLAGNSLNAWAAKPAPDGFFRLAEHRGRWWLRTPEGRLFFSLALNHIDSAPLRQEATREIWERKYGNSHERWLKESVRPHLLAWGFNSVGWVQEVVTRGLTNHRHSRNFTFEEYQWLDMPYCHMLPFADFHQWEAETRHPSIQSSDFADWCDYVARDQCARFARDPKLIGYFYIDCPTWVHTRKENVWKGPLFDPERLHSEAGRKELHALASRYYQVTHDAIRRYDPNHLILGDRYEANAPLPMEVVRAAAPYVDVLSFQDFQDPAGHLKQWHSETGKPVLWADGAKPEKRGFAGGYLSNDAEWYARQLAGFRENPGCVGAHLCGAYIANNVRRRGLLGPQEQPDECSIAGFTKAHREMEAWVRGFEG